MFWMRWLLNLIDNVLSFLKPLLQWTLPIWFCLNTSFWFCDIIYSRSRFTRSKTSFWQLEGKMRGLWRLRRVKMLWSSKLGAQSTCTLSVSLILRKRTSWSNLFHQVCWLHHPCFTSLISFFGSCLVPKLVWSHWSYHLIKGFSDPMNWFKFTCSKISNITVLGNFKLTNMSEKYRLNCR